MGGTEFESMTFQTADGTQLIGFDRIEYWQNGTLLSVDR